MHPGKWIILAATASVALAGCVAENIPEESADDADARHFTVDVPAGATQVHVDVTGRATGGEPDATVLIENENGNNLASDTFSVGSATERRVSADVDGQARLVVTVRVVDGNAELDVRVSATVPDQAEPVVIVRERVIIVQVAEPTPTTGTTTPPTPASSTPVEPTPVSSTPTTSPTNSTNTTNATG